METIERARVVTFRSAPGGWQFVCRRADTGGMVDVVRSYPPLGPSIALRIGQVVRLCGPVTATWSGARMVDPEIEVLP